MITAQTVRQALKELGHSHWSGVAEFLKVQTYEERKKVRQVLVDLVKARQANYEGCEIYHLTDKPARGAVQAKLWEFACLRFATAKPFTYSEAARLAECDRDYTKRYCRWLWNTGYLAIVARGRAGALLYQVVGGKERCPAPPWNRRAEKRKSSGQLPVASCQNGDKKQDTTRSETSTTGSRERLDAALEDFGRALVEVAGGIERAWEIIREMKGELLAVEEQGHGEPADGHH